MYYRPIIQNETPSFSGCYHIGNQPQWFEKVEIIERCKEPVIVAASDIPLNVLKKLTSPRGIGHFQSLVTPFTMGILNITPDSFSDGGKNYDPSNALKAADAMIASGIDIIDIGGESTRPGAKEVAEEVELLRIEPVIKTLKRKHPNCKISVDTRKSNVMSKVIELGVDFINDVSAMTFDKKSAEVLAKENVPVFLMHGGLNPENMQNDTNYNDVLLDVYDYLNERAEVALAAGIKKENIIVDPGIGFGKLNEQNIVLIRKASIFHSLGYPVLYGVSRKRFIGKIGGAPEPPDRFPGSITVALELIRQGVQGIRIHDFIETHQALNLWRAISEG